MSESKSFFDFQKLSQTFAKICPDYNAEPSFDQPSESRCFAEQIIFEYSKEAKLAKDQNKDKTWRTQFNDIEIIVSTFITRPPPTEQQPKIENNQLELTFKQASLLAVSKYCQLVPHLVLRNQIILTPLASAVFNKRDIPLIADALKETLVDVIKEVISSCQTNGYYLPHSQCHFALMALNETVSDLKMRASLIKKTIKMYKLHGKEFDMEKFKICSEFMQKRRKTEEDATIDDQLVNQVMSFTMTARQPAGQSAKKPLKCAANFGQGNKK